MKPKTKAQYQKAIRANIKSITGGKPFTEEEILNKKESWPINHKLAARERLLKKFIAPYITRD